MIQEQETTLVLEAARPAPQVLAAIDLALKVGAADIAEQAARALIGLFPDTLAPSTLLGRALVEQGRWRHAIDHFRWVLACHPLDSVAWAGLAAALAVGGQQREARAALARAALHDPLDSQMLTPGVVTLPPEGSGVSYLRQGHDEIARAELAKALATAPDRDDLRLYYVETLRRCGAPIDALLQLNALTEEGSQSFPALLLRAALDVNAQALRSQGARYDLDGTLTRRFFAPLRPPWDLLPPPSIILSDALLPLEPFLAHMTRGSSPAGQKRAGMPQLKVTPPSPPQVPADVRSFIETAERMRTQLISSAIGAKPLLDHADSERQIHLLVSTRGALARRFGMDGAIEIDRRLQVLAGALQQRGVSARVIYTDDADSLRLADGANLAPVASDAPAIAGLVRKARDVISGQGQDLGALLLIGGPECVPFFRLPNPLQDDDPELLSDLLYAGQDDTDLTPAATLARIPDGGELSLLLDQLDRMIARHSGRPRGPFGLLRTVQAGPVQTPWTLAGGYAAEVWRDPSRAVLDMLHPAGNLDLCPPNESSGYDPGSLLGSAVAYFNLHGALGRSNWYGQPGDWAGPATRLPIALTPDQMSGRCTQHGILVSEACYGLELTGRTVANSIPLRALREGTAACIGSTVSAYGSYATPLVGGDLLCERLMAQLAAGAPAGVALRQARIEFAQTLYRRQGTLDDVDRKTLLSFVLYGDPWASVAVGAQQQSMGMRVLTHLIRPARQRPATPVDERQLPHDVIQKVRMTLRKVLPGADAARLAIFARVGQGLSLKGDEQPELVFSASEQVPTDDGATITQAAHITVSRNSVVKVALSR